MRILIISNMYPSTQKPYSGIFVKNQYEYLKDDLEQNIELYAMPRTFTNKLGSIGKYLNFYIAFFPYLFKHYDILHVHFFGYHTFLAYIYKVFHPKVKFVITFHGSDTDNIKKTTFKYILKKVDTIISVGEEQSKYIFEKTKFQKIIILPAGINEKVFYKESKIEKKYDYIFIGSFYKIKGVDIFIDAISKLNNKNLKYCFVGGGKFLSKIRQLQDVFNVVIKENQTQDEIRLLLNQSNWLILPSRGDSFGLVVSEAMYCATPVIVSNIGGMKDQVLDGRNGYILEYNTPKELVNMIEQTSKITKSEYVKLSLNAENSNKQYSMKHIAETLITLYKDLVL